MDNKPPDKDIKVISEVGGHLDKVLNFFGSQVGRNATLRLTV